MMLILEDTITQLPVYVTDNVFVAQCLRTGILDLALYDTEDPKHAMMIRKVLEDSRGASTVKNGPLDLSRHPTTGEKARLAAIRGPVFRYLIERADDYRVRNRFGYSEHDMLAVARALDDPKAIADYARITGVGELFAREELQLMLETKTKDDFKVFTICEMWRRRINECTAHEQADKLKSLIRSGFYMPGVFDE
jgi:hypothetical protein